MTFDFDEPVDRRGTHSSKWDGMEKRTGVGAPDAIAMWVADMDFKAPPAVLEAVREEAERGVYGYYNADGSWQEAMSGWLKRRHGYEPDPEHIIPVPGVVPGLGLILQAFSEPDDEVVVFSPAYHGFNSIITANGRRIHNQPLINEQGRYRMDFEGLASSLSPRARIVFFCSPHNPGGRVWTREEIRELAEFCEANDLLLVSDEIHQDLVFTGNKHLVTEAVAPEFAHRIITCTAATKTFNLAGAHYGGVIIPDDAMREKFRKVVNRSGLASLPLFSMVLTEAAHRHGDAWLDALLPYLETNRDLLAERIAKGIPGSRPMHLEATYLGWVDFSGTGLDQEAVLDRIGNRARIGASTGAQFGPGGENWVRFNFATQRKLLVEALDRLDEAFSDLARG
ncbi:MAG: pyridoxal phosphate-dependent aminotransferase [Nitratireductor sp.]|nr:pyridoxal phosphate-dependent aminotransferase [Nitratireductor sp.]